jgi:hypothetical protein
MSMAAFFLVVFEHENAMSASGVDLPGRDAPWNGLSVRDVHPARHRCGSFDFADFDGLGGVADVVFVLAVIGFRAKAGFSAHVLLPEAHPAARRTVGPDERRHDQDRNLRPASCMVLANTGPRGGRVLIGIGIASGLGGVIYALVQSRPEAAVGLQQRGKYRDHLSRLE